VDDPRLRIDVTSGESWAVGWASDSPDATPGWRVRANKEGHGQSELVLEPTDAFIAVRTQEREGFVHAFNGMLLEEL
jgi:hypothetical protein